MTQWPVVRLGGITEVIAGQSPEGKHYNAEGEGLPFYQGKKDFGARSIDPPRVWTREVTKVAEAGDILMSVRAPVGPVNFAVERCCIGRGLAAIRPGAGVLGDFLFHYLESIQSKLEGSEGAVFSSINKSQISAIEVLLPPLDEQKRIVAKLDEILGESATLQGLASRRKRGLEDFVAAFRRDALLSVRGQSLTPACSLGSMEEQGLVQIGRGKVISKQDLAATPGDFPVYSSSGSGAGEFGRYGKFAFDEEMITWSVDGGGHLFYRPRHKFSVTNVGGWIRILNAEKVSCAYLYEVLTDMHSRVAFDWVSKAHSGVIKKVYDEIYLPSLEEQEAVVAQIKRAVEESERAIAALEEEHRLVGDLVSASRAAILSGGP